MENQNGKSLYEIRMEEIEQLKNSIENQIKLSRTNMYRGSLIERNKKMAELKEIIDDIRKQRQPYKWQEIFN